MTATTTYTFDDNTVSDLHKDAYGCRPREQFWRNWKSFTDAQKQAEWDYMVEQLEITVARENAMEQEAIARFEARITRLTIVGAGDRATAIKWLKEAEGDQYVADEEYFEYLQGIPYGYIAKTSKA